MAAGLLCLLPREVPLLWLRVLSPPPPLLLPTLRRKTTWPGIGNGRDRATTAAVWFDLSSPFGVAIVTAAARVNC